MNDYPKMLFLALDTAGEIAANEEQETQMREAGFKTYAELQAEPEQEPEQEPEPEQELSIYDGFSVAELQAELKQRGVDFKVKDTKPVLIKLLVVDDETD